MSDAVNLCVFAACFELLGAHHLVAATPLNFVGNKMWSFVIAVECE